MTFDIAIRGGTVIDGIGSKRFPANIGIEKGKITAVTPEPITGRDSIDATGTIVAPGFIDIHSHCDWVLPLESHSATLGGATPSTFH